MHNIKQDDQSMTYMHNIKQDYQLSIGSMTYMHNI